MVGLIAKWLIRSILFAIILLGMSACTMLGLNYASLDTENKPALSPVLTADFDRDETRAIFERELYGPWPGDLPYTASEPRMIDANYKDGRGTLQEVMVTIGEGETSRTFPIVLALPNRSGTDQVPLIISQTFSSNCSVFPDSPVTAADGSVCDGSDMTGFFGLIGTQIFGTFIAKAPVERYFDAGLGYASFYASTFVPDSNEVAQSVMANLGPGTQPTSALMAWAYGFEVAANIFADTPGVNSDAILSAGHSRFGKAALIAAAWSDDIAGAVTHQSGFAGAASSRSTTGETLPRMAESYPHWVRPGLPEDLEAGTELTLDQHFLIALAAPKPVFLGNGRRDVWSDPNSTYRAALAADAVYESYGLEGLPETEMRDFDPAAELSYWLRAGGHSVVSEDIDAFIAFTTAHFSTSTGE